VQAASVALNLAQTLDKLQALTTQATTPGQLLAGLVYDQETILLAALDLNDIIRSKLDFDVTGHYALPDAFQLVLTK
jgi:hypothetical protein